MAKALEARGVHVKGNADVMVTTLTRRVKKGKLKAKKDSESWVYWTE